MSAVEANSGTTRRCASPWCGKELHAGNRYGGTTGRPPKYCDERCRQAAYRWRKNQPCPGRIQLVVPGQGQLNIDRLDPDAPPGVITVRCEGKVNHSGPCSGRPWVNWVS